MSKSDSLCLTCGTTTYLAQNGHLICPLCRFGSNQHIPPYTTITSEKLHFHLDVVELANLTPSVTQEQLWLLRRVEYLLKQQLPASFFEWFVRIPLPVLLANQLNDAHLTNLEQSAQNLIKPILPFLVENQGICQWGIALDDGEDPTVLVKVEDTHWQTCTTQFSEFVYWAFHDHRHIENTYFTAHTPPLTRKDLLFMETVFMKQAQTYGWPGKVNYRFHNEKGNILIWAGEEQTDWWIAPNKGQTVELLEQIWGCKGISQFLYARNDESEDILQKFRLDQREVD